MTLLTPGERAEMLGHATSLQDRCQGGPRPAQHRGQGEILQRPDEYGMVHLIVPTASSSRRRRAARSSASPSVPLVAYSECTTTRLRADAIDATPYANAPNISRAFFSEMADEIAGELDDINYEREKSNA